MIAFAESSAPNHSLNRTARRRRLRAVRSRLVSFVRLGGKFSRLERFNDDVLPDS